YNGKYDRTAQGSDESSVVVSVLTYAPIFSAFYPDGSLVGRVSGKVSPYASAMAAKRHLQNDRLITNQYAEYQFNNYLKAKINFSYDLSSSKTDAFADKIL